MPQTQAIGDHGDELGIRGLALYIRHGVAEEFLQRFDMIFYKEGYPIKDGILDEPRLIDQGQVTEDLFLNENVKILEMNSKSGLYPLYVAYSIYRILLPKPETEMTLEEAQAVWDKVLADHLYVLCQTTMAVSITKRTLAGYRKADVKALYLTRLLDRMQDKKRLSNNLNSPLK